jgi:hypothetical protein
MARDEERVRKGFYSQFDYKQRPSDAYVNNYDNIEWESKDGKSKGSNGCSNKEKA